MLISSLRAEVVSCIGEKKFLFCPRSSFVPALPFSFSGNAPYGVSRLLDDNGHSHIK